MRPCHPPIFQSFGSTGVHLRKPGEKASVLSVQASSRWRGRGGMPGTRGAQAEAETAGLGTGSPRGGRVGPAGPGKGSLLVAAVPWFHWPCGDLSLCPCFFTDAAALFRARRKSRRDSYQPPLASDIERMKATRLKEQKAFALIREILGRQPKLPTRNLLTCLFSTQA